MRVELHTAVAARPEKFDGKDRPIDVVLPGHPVEVARFTPRDTQDGAWFVIGRYRDPDDNHWAWTARPDVRRPSDEDADLSRDQLLVERRDGRWQVSVPGEPYSKPDATVQYWASERTSALRCGEEPLVLDPGSHVCVVVHTRVRFYWALFAVPPEPARQRRISRLLRGDRPTSGPVTVPAVHGPRTPPRALPKGWQEVVAIKFRPFLSWPMGWRPRPVPPRRFPPPPERFVRRAAEPDQARARWAESVRKRLEDLKFAANTRGYDASSARGIEVSLLEWLVITGELRFADARCSWLPHVEPSPDDDPGAG